MVVASLVHPLLRFLDKDNGPIVGLHSRSFPGIDDGFFWYTLALLHPSLEDEIRRQGVLVFAGAGWSQDKQVSQEKAIVEGIERWALRLHTKEPEKAGLHIDPTSNGFAAGPSHWDSIRLYRHAHFEAIERWVLSSFWKNQNIDFQEISPPANGGAALFTGIAGHLRVFKASISSSEFPLMPSQSLEMYLSLFQFADTGGVVPGSACDLAQNQNDTIERAILENFNHAQAFQLVRQGQSHLSSSITHQRLLNFATSRQLASEVFSRLKAKGTVKLESPKVIFFSDLAGPWEPEVKVVV